MDDKEDKVSAIFKAMRSLVNRSFPIECSCGKIYYNLDEFLAGTTKPDGAEHGLFGPTEYPDRSIANLLRACPNCDSTLMAVFSERRDTTDRGYRVREVFNRILAHLEQQGLPAATAKQELRGVVRGEDGPQIQQHLMGQAEEDLRQLLTMLAEG